MFTSKAKRPVTFLRTPAVILLVLFMISSTWIAIAKVASPQVEAATNSTVNFQARLLNNTGSVVSDGNYNVEFKLYDDPSTGTALWTETRTTTNRVRVVNGYLTVNLGSVQAFTNINWDQELWLTMNIGGTASTPSWDGEMTPRLKLTAVPYAMRAGSVIGGSGSNTTMLDAGTPSGNNLLHLPAESGTLCVQGSSACGFLTGAAGNYIQNQNAVDQTANLRISGSVQAGTLLSTLIDTSSAAALNIGGTATAINLNDSTTVNSTLTVAGGLTTLTGATSGDALSVNNSTSTGNIAVFKDNGTAVATIADGGAVTFKNTSNSTLAFQVQNASNVALFSVDTSGSRVAAKVNTGTIDSMPLLVQQSGAGDVGIEVKGVSNSYNVGIDASDSNKFKISSSTASASSTSNFGITDSTGTNDSGNNNMIVANKVTSNNAGTLSSISIYINALDATNKLMQVGIYADATNKPGALLANTSSQTLTTGWNTFPISTPISGVTTYWLAYQTNGVNTQERITSGSVRFYDTTYGTWNSNLSAVTADAQSSIQFIMYGTVTSGGTADNYNRSLLTLSETGQTTLQNSTNSSSAFQIQNAAGQSLLQVSSSTSQVTLGTVDQDVQLNMTGDLSWGAPLTSAQGFESTTFPATSPATWTTGSQGTGSSVWTRVTTDYQTGVASAASGATNNAYGTSWMDLNYTFASSGTISFYWKVSSEAGYDPLMFCLDNDDCDVDSGGDYQRISGEVAWTKVTVPVTAGAHSFRWVYARDDSGTGGSNKAWLDNVQFTSGGGSGTIRGDALTFIASDSVTFQAGGNTSALVVSSDGKVGIGTATPTEALSVIGDSSVKNSAGTKAYRTRTSGGSIDVEAGGSNLYFSTWADAALATNQHQYIIMYSGGTTGRMDIKSDYTWFLPLTDTTSTIDVSTIGTGAQTFMRFIQGGVPTGDISVLANGNVTYNAFSGSHYAWSEHSIEDNMLVSLTGNNKRRDADDFSKEPYYGVAKTSQANDPKVLGTFGNGEEGDWSFDKPDYVTAVGNGMIWVTDEGGDVQPGDELISATVAGYAMKDTNQFAQSYVVAKATDKIDWNNEAKVVNGHKVKLISVVYTPYTRLNATGLAMGLANGSIISNDLEFTGMVTFSKAVTFKSSTTFEGLIKVSGDTAGTVKIPAGQTSATVNFSQPYLAAPKITTGTSEFVDIAVDNKTNNGFTVRIPNPRGSDTYVDWTAFQTP